MARKYKKASAEEMLAYMDGRAAYHDGTECPHKSRCATGLSGFNTLRTAWWQGWLAARIADRLERAKQCHSSKQLLLG